MGIEWAVLSVTRTNSSKALRRLYPVATQMATTHCVILSGERKRQSAKDLLVARASETPTKQVAEISPLHIGLVVKKASV